MSAPGSAAAPPRTVAESLSALVRDISSAAAAGAGQLRPECLRLARKVSLLSHLLDEITDFFTCSSGGSSAEASSSSAVDPAACLEELLMALMAAKKFISLGRLPPPLPDSDNKETKCEKIAVQFKYVMWQLEKALANLPYNHFGISEEIQEQVELVRAQLTREMEKKETPDAKLFSEIHDIVSCHSDDFNSELEEENTGVAIGEMREIVSLVAEINGICESDFAKITCRLIERLEETKVSNTTKNVGIDNDNNSKKSSNNGAKKSTDKVKKSDSIPIPEDFRCPISLELMRDPVIVSTGQTYERAFIQRWIDCGNRTCPKTQQKLQNLTLTPNYVLRSLITQWCEEHGIEPPSRSKSDGSSLEIGGDRAAIEALVRNLSSTSLDERKSAAAEIRSLAKRSTDNRILLAEAGAIPSLVALLSSKDSKTQEHAVTSLLNLSIYDHNKELIVLAGAIVPIVQVLRMGSMEARENAAAAIFSLSLIDENKITIGSTPGAIESLVDLLQSGSSRGRKDAATALFNLCIYQANKVRAVRAGILSPLIQMLQDSSNNGTIDEALTILSVLVSHQECKIAIGKANTIPFLIDLLRSGQPRNKENAAAILLALCKKDTENLACIGRLGALIPLTELTRTGTDRAKRKATSLLEHLSKLQVL